MEFETLNPQGGYNGVDANENEMQNMPQPEVALELQALQKDLLTHQQQLSREAAEEAIGSFNPNQHEPVNEEQRNARWESNHRRIMKTIIDLVERYGYMPTKTDIAISCGISRQSVHQHLNHYRQSMVFRNQLDHYQFVAPAIIDSLMVKSLKGDTRAAKVFLDSLRTVNAWKPLKSQMESKAIEVGKLKLTQEMVDRLNAEEREAFLKVCLRVKEIVFTNL